ncbi:MAG: DUF1559 domain-containing protein [Armatimonadetes bacterium]|nr:DUF1559 domain-containing protein [Armatimonadota bacterium]
MEEEPARTRPLFSRFISVMLKSLLVLFVIAVFWPLHCGQSSREKARKSTCLKNLRQLGMAFEAYIKDWDGSFPDSTQDKSVDGAAINASAWDVQIAGYVKADATFKCPGNSLKRYSVHQNQKIQPPLRRIVSYAYNDQFCGVPASGTEPMDRTQGVSVTAARVKDPAGMILLAEMKGWNRDNANRASASLASMAEVHPWFHVTGPGMDEDTWQTGWGVARDVHSGGSNYLYADYHVKWKKLEDTLGRPATEAFNKVGGTYPNNEWMLNYSPL